MKKFGLLGLCLITSAAVAVTDYQYVADPVTGYNSQGVPLGMTNINSTLPVTILNNIYSMLPESTVVNPVYIAPDSLSNIRFDDDLAAFATASVTFLNEGAGYRNSLGYFIYDTNNPPATKADISAHIIIFPNASKPVAGNMQQGDTVELGIQITAGQSIGFFVVPNGWGSNGSGSTIVSDGPWNTPFYSLHQLNPEPVGAQRHNVVFVDALNELLVIGFDDQYTTSGDQDYNDVLFTVNISPFFAVDGVNEDGSVDAGYITLSQELPSLQTTTSYYPSQNGFATIMFEDRWPVFGDYDFNDLVVRYQLKRTLASQNGLSRLEATYQIQAKGADYHNGFALHLPGISQGNIAAVSLLKNGVAVSHEIVETAASDTVLIISPDIEDDLIRSCEMFRTLPTCVESVNLEYQLDVSFIVPVLPAVVGQAPYDPFIFAADGFFHGESFATPPGRQWEVHLKQFAGTSLFNTAFFLIGDDASNGSNSFVSSNNMPWVINVTGNCDHPAERRDISQAYPDFANWVAADGFSFYDWYDRVNADTTKLYE